MPKRATKAPVLVFSHANSFPAGTYRKLFEIWRAAGYRVEAIESFGHNPKYPVSHHWPRLRDELVDFIDKEVKAPAFLVGHSLGGFLSLLAAARRPDLARGVVLLDSPVIGGVLGTMVQFAKLTGFGARFSPGHLSQRRRQHWPNAEAVHTHFASKPAFARWDPEVLTDYIRSGFVPSTPPMEPGQTLAFHRDIETRIYNTLPTDIPAFLRKHPLQCPVSFVGGRDSIEVRRVGLVATEQVTQGRISWLEGTHLFPFEHPELTAEQVLRDLSAFQAPAVTKAG